MSCSCGTRYSAIPGYAATRRCLRWTLRTGATTFFLMTERPLSGGSTRRRAVSCGVMVRPRSATRGRFSTATTAPSFTTCGRIAGDLFAVDLLAKTLGLRHRAPLEAVGWRSTKRPTAILATPHARRMRSTCGSQTEHAERSPRAPRGSSTSTRQHSARPFVPHSDQDRLEHHSTCLASSESSKTNKAHISNGAAPGFT